MNESDCEAIEASLSWLGIEAMPDDCDVCESGQVYFGLTEVLPRGSVIPDN